ncbi:hypothetical protein C8R43DRAFT_1228809 [Mycena crocata]|nr:hypothetical protein C8R43DRAFT_1228809 [Mycena crocata]
MEWLSRAFSYFQANAEMDPEFEKLQRLEIASGQSDDPDACNAALQELQELAQETLSPFTFRVFEVLSKFLAIGRIPKQPSSGEVYERLVFSAAIAMWSYPIAKRKNPADEQLDAACIGILPQTLQWIDFLHAHFLGDLIQDIHLRENAWGGANVFLGMAVGHPQMFGSRGEEIILAIVKLWVLEAALDNSFSITRHLPARLLQKLIACHGERYDDMIMDAMSSLGPAVASRAAIHHLSSVTDIESDNYFLEAKNETLLIRMMITSMDLVHPLLSNGVLRLLIKTLSYATRESYTDDPASSSIMTWLVQNSCEALQLALGRTTGVIMCRQAFDLGILAPLLRADKWHTRLSPAHFPNVPYIHSSFLIQTLATYTIYPCVLRAAAITIQKVPSKLQANLDKSGPMRKAWSDFKDVVRRRLEVPGAPSAPFEPSICSNLFADRPTIPNEETVFAHKVALHELETHKNFILQKWRTAPNNHSPMVVDLRNNTEYEQEDPRSRKIQVVIMNYEQDHLSAALRPTIAFTSAPMFEHTGLPMMDPPKYRQEWNSIKSLAEKPQKRGMRTGIVVVRIPEGMFTVRKFFSLLSYSAS